MEQFLNKPQLTEIMSAIRGYIDYRTSRNAQLSVSQRRGLVVGRCIPQRPRKGKIYYFADGSIKMKTAQGIDLYYVNVSSQDLTPTFVRTQFDVRKKYTRCLNVSHYPPPNESGTVIAFSNVVKNICVRILVETRPGDTFSLNYAEIFAIHPADLPRFSLPSESPNFDIVSGKVVNISEPKLGMNLTDAIERRIIGFVRRHTPSQNKRGQKEYKRLEWKRGTKKWRSNHILFFGRTLRMHKAYKYIHLFFRPKGDVRTTDRTWDELHTWKG